LYPYVEDKGLGTSVTAMLFVLDAEHDLRRRPHVAFVSAARWPLDRALPGTGDWDVVPDLAVEVISPNDVFKDVLAKVCEYFHYGVQVVWVIGELGKIKHSALDQHRPYRIVYPLRR
jgi:Uma2 family endonuclease